VDDDASDGDLTVALDRPSACPQPLGQLRASCGRRTCPHRPQRRL